MAKVRQEVLKLPKLPPAPRAAFDEQRWPVNVALFVIGGFTAGIILATCRLDDPRFFDNGWVRLVALAVGLAGLLWVAGALDSRRVRRGLQMAALLSLFTHVVVMLVLQNQRFTVIADSSKPEHEQSDIPVRGPRFLGSEPERTSDADELTKPTEAEIVPEQEVPVEVVRKPTKLEDVPTSQPTPEPAIKPEVRPSLVESRQPEEATPRQASRAAGPEKQIAKVEPRAGAPAAVPKLDSDARSQAVDARATLDRRPQELALAKRPEAGPEKNTVQPRAAELSQRERVESVSPTAPSPPTTAKKGKQETVSPGAANLPQVAAQPSTKPKFEPSAAMKRQEQAQPQGGKGTATAEPKAAAVAQAASIEHRTREGDLPQLAAQQASASARSTKSAVLTAEIGAKPKLPAANARAIEPAIAPAANSIARVETGAAAPATSGDLLQGFGSLPSASKNAAAGSPIERADVSAVPSLKPDAATANRIARARRAAKVEASPANMESPGIAESVEPGQGVSQPGGRTVLAHRATGIPGAGREESFRPGMQGSPGPRELAALPAGGPKKSAALQQTAGGGAPGSGLPATVAKSNARTRVASASLVAEDVTLASIGGNGGAGSGIGDSGGTGTGASGTARVGASSDAALQRGNSGTGPATTTSAVGSGAAGTGGAGTGIAGTGGVEIGPPQTAANAGSNRSSSGGAPRVRLNTEGQRIAKAGLGSQQIAAISAKAVAAAPEAPSGEGGGSPFGQGGDSLDAGLLANGSTAAAQRGGGGGSLPTSPPPTGTLPTGASADSPGGFGGGGVRGGRGTGAVVAAALGRAATDDDATGAQPAAGRGQPGGTRGLRRSTGRGTGVALADATADAGGVSEVAGSGESSESLGTGALQYAGGDARRPAAGLPGGTAQADSNTADAGLQRPGAGQNTAARAQRSTAVGDGAPEVAGTGATGPLRKAMSTAGTVVAEINGPALDGAAEGSTASASDISNVRQSAVPGETGVTRQPAAGTLPTQLASLPEAGGLGAGFTPEVGSLNRRTELDHEVVHPGTARFLNRKTDGPLAIDGRARQPAEAYAGRAGQRKVKKGGGGIAERNEQAIARGLDFLARHQSEDGRWSLNDFGAGQRGYEEEQASFRSDTAATGLALLSFLGAGYDHFDDEYRHVVREGLDFLLRSQKPNGDLYLPMDAESNKSAWFYSHGIATIALCEAYGMTGDEALRGPAQKAINFIVSSQSPRLGVWRYAPQYGSDTSASGWQLMALKSGELAGLRIAPETYPRVKRWLDAAQVSKTDGSQYVYNPYAADTDQQRHGRRPTSAMTAVGLLMRLYLGSNRDDPQMIAGAEHLLADLPAIGTQAQPARDTYYWYYATQVMFHMRGKYWKEWNDRLHPLLVERQVPSGPLAGSWDPLGPVPDKWGPAGGRIYVTTLNLLSLEVYYRHLPIYEATAR